MRIVNVVINDQTRVGLQINDQIHVMDTRWAQTNGVPCSVLQVIEYVNSHSEEALLDLYLNDDNNKYVSVYSLEAVTYAPVVPRGKKIVCVGLNYTEHAQESRLDLTPVPLLFSKFDNTLIGHNRVVLKPAQTHKLDYEAEIAMVIGRRARNVCTDSALDYVFGYTPANDLSARDLQFVTSQWLLGKSCDDLCPIGPALVTPSEIGNLDNLAIQCTVNGKVRQQSSTANMIFPFAELVSYISQHITLEPGDTILTGTPPGVIFGLPEDEQIWLQPGDEIVVEVENLGALKTTIG